jgi:hypothetical protein
MSVAILTFATSSAFSAAIDRTIMQYYPLGDRYNNLTWVFAAAMLAVQGALMKFCPLKKHGRVSRAHAQKELAGKASDFMDTPPT